MRNRYRHEKHGEITSFRELLDVFESEETIEAPEQTLTPVVTATVILTHQRQLKIDPPEAK